MPEVYTPTGPTLASPSFLTLRLSKAQASLLSTLIYLKWKKHGYKKPLILKI